jgi:hypothetical protein
MFPRANILLVEPAGGQDESVAACLKRSLAQRCSLARTAEDDVLYLANRYDFDCVVFGRGLGGERTAKLSAVIRAIKPRMLVVALSGARAGEPGHGPGPEADPAVSEQCRRLAQMLRAAAGPGRQGPV